MIQGYSTENHSAHGSIWLSGHVHNSLAMGSTAHFQWVPAQFRWEWDTPLQPASDITHSRAGGWEGVCHHSVSMCFGTQAHSIKPKGQSTSLRNEASAFEGNLSVGGHETVKLQNPKGYQVGNFHSQLLQPRKIFASERWEVTIKGRASGLWRKASCETWNAQTRSWFSSSKVRDICNTPPTTKHRKEGRNKGWGQG